jgi:hypothetical protein
VNVAVLRQNGKPANKKWRMAIQDDERMTDGKQRMAMADEAKKEPHPGATREFSRRTRSEPLYKRLILRL